MFYNTVEVKRRRFQAKLRSDAELKKAYNGLLGMLEGRSKAPAQPDKFIVLGAGGFDVGNGPAGTFERHFIAKAKSLGYRVIVVNEYR